MRTARAHRVAARRARGFTLLELSIALVLLALMGAVVYGALGFAGTSWDKGEAKVEATSGMRLAQEFMRAQLEQQHPLRMRKVAEFPLLFSHLLLRLLEGFYISLGSVPFDDFPRFVSHWVCPKKEPAI